MRIERINSYQDPRFSQMALNQHGAFLVDDRPYEVEIISDFEALVRGEDPQKFLPLIGEFRFYAPHITRFLSGDGNLVHAFPKADVFTLPIENIQPSQFYIDEDKLAAVETFLQRPEDIVIQVTPYQGHYLSPDGHTRLFYAVKKGWSHVQAVEADSDECLFTFAEEAHKRGVASPEDLILLPHSEYEEKWNRFCDDFFASRKE